jgi:AcrR family transcriptional regulator
MTISYPTETRHTQATRQAILDAGIELLLERRDDGFTMQEVADRAGLTHRTVYRYFPTRQGLLAAVARVLSPGIEDFRDVSSVEEWVTAIGPHLARIEADLTLVRQLLAAVLGSKDGPLEARPDRDAHRWEVFRAEFPHLDDRDARRTFATLRHLTSSSSYLLYRLRFRLAPAEAVEAILTAARLIVHDAASRDRLTAAGSANDA